MRDDGAVSGQDAGGDVTSGAGGGHDTSPDRLLAFTDGVFAIIITILVLEIGVPPDLDEASLRQALEDLQPTLVAWVISFLLTGMYWVSHRDLFARVTTVTRDLVWLNLLFLLPVALIPFAASVLGEYPDEPLALHIFGVVLLASSGMRVVLYRYVSRRPVLLSGPPSTRTGLGLALSAAPVPVYLVAMLVADLSTGLSKALFFSVPALYFALVRILRDRPASASEADEFT